MNQMLRDAVCIGLCMISVRSEHSFAEDKDKKGSDKQIAKIVWLEVDKAGRNQSIELRRMRAMDIA